MTHAEMLEQIFKEAGFKVKVDKHSDWIGVDLYDDELEFVCDLEGKLKHFNNWKS